MQNFSQIQERLRELGFYKGEIDGNVASSRQSIIEFQRSKGLAADGIVGPITRRALFETIVEQNSERRITSIIKKVLPDARNELLAGIEPFLESELSRIEVKNSKRRLAAFLGQTSVECAYYRTLRELGQLSYFERIYGHRTTNTQTIAPRNPKHRSDLRYWYIGRGLIQLTWDFNYRKASEITGQDFLAEPWRVESFEWATKSATIFWEKNDCNSFADRWDIVGLTRRINGGTNHLRERIKYCNMFLKELD